MLKLALWRIDEALIGLPLHSRFFVAGLVLAAVLIVGACLAYSLWVAFGRLLCRLIILGYVIVSFGPRKLIEASNDPRGFFVELYNDCQDAVEGAIRIVLFWTFNHPDHFESRKRTRERPPLNPRPKFVLTTLALLPLVVCSYSAIQVLMLSSSVQRAGPNSDAMHRLRDYCALEAQVVGGPYFELARLGTLRANGEMIIAVPSFDSLDWTYYRRDGQSGTLNQRDVTPRWPLPLKLAEQPVGEDISESDMRQFVDEWANEIQERQTGSLLAMYSAPPHYWSDRTFDVRYRASVNLPSSASVEKSIEGGEETTRSRYESIRRLLETRVEPFTDEEIERLMRASQAEVEGEHKVRVQATLSSMPPKTADGTYEAAVEVRHTFLAIELKGHCELRLVKTNGTINIVSETGSLSGGAGVSPVFDLYRDGQSRFCRILESLMQKADEKCWFGSGFSIEGDRSLDLDTWIELGGSLDPKGYGVEVRLDGERPAHVAQVGNGYSYRQRASLDIVWRPRDVAATSPTYRWSVKGEFFWTMNDKGELTLVKVADARIDDQSPKSSPPPPTSASPTATEPASGE